MGTRYYDFTREGARVGYFEITEESGEIRMNARFEVDGSLSVNPFVVRLENGLPSAVLPPDGERREVEAGHYPSAAWPVVLRSGVNEYSAFDETTGAVRTLELRREGDLVVEYDGDRKLRSFGIEDGVVTYINWGGAESRLAASRADAVRGTAFE